jgi:hypothetical protein
MQRTQKEWHARIAKECDEAKKSGQRREMEERGGTLVEGEPEEFLDPITLSLMVRKTTESSIQFSLVSHV